ncbi:MAG: nuclear transport factor 2 family protein [Candidatus Binatia bacterium]
MHGRPLSRILGALSLVTLLIAASAASANAAPAPPTDAALERTRAMVELFKARFVKIGPALAENLDQLYTEDIAFRDPISTARGLPDLQRYFARFAEVSAGAHFEITDEIIQPGQAAVFWTMVMVNADGSEARRFQGVSQMKVRDRIFEERDYFDLGEAVYDHVPVINWFTRLVRSRLD